jgi:hypothetical protein
MHKVTLLTRHSRNSIYTLIQIKKAYSICVSKNFSNEGTIKQKRLERVIIQ